MNTTHGSSTTAQAKWLRWLLLWGYVCLIIYGSLYPFTGWQMPTGVQWLFSISTDFSAPDMLANVLFYIPFGFLLILGRRLRAIPAIILSALALSTSMETAQAFLPNRVTSLMDILLNGFGAGMGAVAAQMLRWPRVMLNPGMVKRLQNDRAAWLGIAALVAWICAQLVPFVPSLDVGNLKAGLKPLWYALHGAEPVSLWRCLVYIAATTALTVTGANILRTWRWRAVTAMGLLAVLPLKVLVVGRQLSPEALLGTLVGVALGVTLWKMRRRVALVIAITLIPCYIVAEALQAGSAGMPTHSFNWVPLHAQLVQPINGLANSADTLWPILALACLCARLGMRTLWPLLPALVLLLFGVDWAQRWVPGRYPGITSVLVGTVSWIIAAAYYSRRSED